MKLGQLPKNVRIILIDNVALKNSAENLCNSNNKQSQLISKQYGPHTVRSIESTVSEDYNQKENLLFSAFHFFISLEK